ncbi:hypothetical protein RDI58_022287 [Solanum bulbocastanum]|uniref:Uncharacterized protein n=1 Tax=Solanum bulbocastanum TaxID=147425 RepID=A0AAN8Y7Y1_SOLBU
MHAWDVIAMPHLGDMLIGRFILEDIKMLG